GVAVQREAALVVRARLVVRRAVVGQQAEVGERAGHARPVIELGPQLVAPLEVPLRLVVRAERAGDLAELVEAVADQPAVAGLLRRSVRERRVALGGAVAPLVQRRLGQRKPGARRVAGQAVALAAGAGRLGEPGG